MKFVKAIFALFLIALSRGCISEDYDDCDRGYLHFSYFGDGTTQLFNRKICKVELYVFEQDKCNVIHHSIVGHEDLEVRKTKLDLPPGKYRVVCIGNAHGDTGISGLDAEGLDGIYIAHPNYFTGTDICGNDSLYYGFKSVVFPPQDKFRTVHDTVEFEPSHLKMYMEVIGAEPAVTKQGGSAVSLEVNSLSPYVDFNNRRCDDPSASATYYPETVYDSGKRSLTSRFNILRHPHESPVSIALRRDGDIFYSLRLTDFLDAYPEIDVGKHETLVAIQIRILPDGVVISIPDWVIRDVEPEM